MLLFYTIPEPHPDLLPLYKELAASREVSVNKRKKRMKNAKNREGVQRRSYTHRLVGAEPHPSGSVTDIPVRCLEALVREGIRVSPYAIDQDRCKANYKKCPTSYLVNEIDAHVAKALGYYVRFAEE